MSSVVRRAEDTEDMMADMEKIFPLEDLVEELPTTTEQSQQNIFKKIKRQLSFTLKRTHSAFFDSRQSSVDSTNSSDEVPSKAVGEERGKLRKGLSEDGKGAYHSPLERCIISREKRLRRRISFDNYSAILGKTRR